MHYILMKIFDKVYSSTTLSAFIGKISIKYKDEWVNPFMQ